MEESRGLKVVIVDDYDMTRTLLRIILRGERFNIVGEAIDGEQGIEMCKKFQPDIVLLDVVMPKMNGIEALKKIRALEHQPMVLMVTSAEEESIVTEAMQLGASGYIVKPFNTASVIDTMNEAREKFVVRNRAALSTRN
jgi:YesN/AraC family two-component response regulator